MKHEKIVILLVEDNPGDARLIQEMLAESGEADYQLEHADRLSQGLDRLLEGRIDVVLLDLSLPDSQGLETLGKVQAQVSAVPIIVLTGLNDEMTAVEAVHQGAQDYLVKGDVDSKLLWRAVHYSLERKRAEGELRESEEKLRCFMDSATDFLTIWDSELNLVDLNIAALSYPSIHCPDGVAKEDYIGRNILDLDPDIKGRGRYDQYLEVIRTGEPLFVEDVLHRPNIGDIYLSVRAFKVGDGLGLLVTDVTEKKNMDETLRQAEKLRALGELAGGVAHDFNNILSVVLGRAQLALADTKDIQAKKSIQIIEQTALDAAGIVRRLREVAVIKGERSFDKVDLNKLIEDAIQMVESRRMELENMAGIKIEIHTEKNGVAPAEGDAAELREALINILFNAMDAMPEGGNITMKSSQEDTSVVLSVSDTGTGIPEEIRGKLFDPFFTTKASKGSGLGLSVTMGLITKHGGSIDVESTEGEGTTFYIRLPMANCVAVG